MLLSVASEPLSCRVSLSNLPGQSAASALSRSNNGLTDIVVCPSREALFFLASLLEQAACRLRTFGLKLAPKLTVAIANILDCLALVDSTVTVNRDIGDANINAQETVNVQRSGLINVADSEQIELAVDTSKVGFALLGLQQLPLVFTANERNYLTPRHCPDRNRVARQAPVEHAVIVGNATQRPKCSLCFLIQLVRIGHFGDAANNDLRRQVELLTNRVVGQFVKRELTKGLCLPCYLANLRASSIGRLKGYLEQFGLFWGGLQLHFSGQFHASIVPQSGGLSKC